MSSEPTPTSTAIAATLNLARALDLARRGQNKAAQAVLTRGAGLPEDPIELQALAALVTDAGEYARALVLWRELLRREPNHAEARRMIAAIELWQSRPLWFRFIPAGAAVLGIALLILVGLAVMSTLTPPPKPPSPPAPIVRPPSSYNSEPATPPPAFNLSLHSPGKITHSWSN